MRYDDGTYAGYTVPVFYDPMIAKLIVWGEDRATAIARAQRALAEYLVVGVTTTIGFHLAALSDADFRAGATQIRFAEEKLADPNWLAGPDASLARALAVALACEARDRPQFDVRHDDRSRWALLHRGRS